MPNDKIPITEVTEKADMPADIVLGIPEGSIPLSKVNLSNGPLDIGGNVFFGNISDTDKIVDANNTKKRFRFDAGSLTASTLRTYAVPDKSGTLVLTNETLYIGTTGIALNRASDALTLAGLTLTTPDIGTPSSGVLTNCTGLPLSGLTSGTLAVDFTQTKASPITNVLTLTGGSNVVTDYIADGEHYRTAVVYKPGATGNCVDLEASSAEYGVVTGGMDLISADDTYTIAAWVKLESFTGTNNFPMIFSHASAATNYLAIASTGYVRWRAGNAAYNDTATGLISTGTWYRIVVVHESSSSGKIYINAVNRTGGTYNPGSAPSYSSVNMNIGRYDAANPGYNFDGLIDEFEIYNVAWSQSDVTADYNSGVGVYHTSSTSGIILGYHFDETGGLVADDFTATNKDCTFTPSCAWATGIIVIPGGDVTRKVFRVIDGVSALEGGKFYFGDSVNNDSSYYIGLTKIPGTTIINQILYSSAANTLAGITAVNSGVLITSAAGVPSISATLPSGIILVAPVLGTPASGNLANCTGYPGVGEAGEGHIRVFLPSYTTVAGTWGWNADNTYNEGQYIGNTSNTINDACSFKVYLAIGTYTFWMVAMISVNGGICDFLIDGVSTSTAIDLYNGSTVKNTVKSKASISVTTAGLKTIQIKVTGKNASSGGYQAYTSSFAMTRTA